MIVSTRKPRYRIFLGLIEIAGHYQSLARGFRELGHKATFVDTIGNCNQYNHRSRHNLLLRIIDFCVARRQQCRNRRVGRMWRLLVVMLKPLLFFYAICTHDVFILGHNTSFLNFRDLPLLKFFGKRVIVQFHGTDGRLRYLDAFFQQNNEYPDVAWLQQQTRKQKWIIRQIDRWADVIINIGPQGHFHERPFVQWLRIGLPSCPEPLPERPDFRKHDTDRPVRILHCPSDPNGKGTPIIRELIEDVRRVRDIEYVEVIGQPNSVVVKELRECDFVIDQVYADYAMAGFATEAAWFGKVALVGGLAVDFWKRELPDEALRPPTLYCYPEQMCDMLLRLIDDEDFRLEQGRRVRDFVEANWTPVRVAEKILLALDNNLPSDWYVDPKDIRYIGGCGMPPERVHNIISRMVDEYGLKSLCVDDKPELKEMFRRLIHREPLPPETGLASLNTRFSSDRTGVND